MKRYRLHIWPIWLLLGMIFLAACQSEALPGDDMGGGKPIVALSDSSYINLRIVNNQTPMTRATEPATAEENAIYDGILAVFRGNSESTAVLESAVVIDQLINNPGSSTGIDITQRLPIGTHPYPDSGNKLYVLALLNTSATGFIVRNNMLYLNNATLEGKTRGEIENMKINSVGNTDKHVGLFMASEPKQTDDKVLRQIYDANWDTNEQCYLYDSKEAISLSTSTKKQLIINVERAAARVRVTNNVNNPDATTLSKITLVGATTEHPLVHKMTWTLNKYNSGAFAIGGGSTNTGIPDNIFAAKDFTYFHQHSYQSGDAVYIGPNNNTDTDDTTEDDDKTEVIVEVQLKDGSFLLGDCFSFAWEPDQLFTSVDALIEYYKSEWNYSFDLSQNADEVFRNTKVTVDANGNVTVKLTNSTFSSEDQKKLNNLAATLSGMTTCYRDGKMYFTYTLDEIVRNNAYNLMLQNSSITGIGRPTP